MSLSRFYRRARQVCRSLIREAHQLRRMCVSLLTIAVAVAKVIDAVAKLYGSWML